MAFHLASETGSSTCSLGMWRSGYTHRSTMVRISQLRRAGLWTLLLMTGFPTIQNERGGGRAQHNTWGLAVIEEQPFVLSSFSAALNAGASR